MTEVHPFDDSKFEEDQCPDCVRGYTHAAEWMMTYLHRISMLGRDTFNRREGQPLHPWLANDPYPASNTRAEPIRRQGPWVDYPILRPSDDILEITVALSGNRKDFTPGRETMLTGLVKALGLPEDWGTCKTCGGHSTLERYPGQRAEAEAAFDSYYEDE